jgi:predicted LPLAT superfamily acyltransferase
MTTRGPARPLFAVSDARFLAELPWLWFVAWFLPESRWDRLCRGLERFKSRLGWFEPDDVAAIMARGLRRDPSIDLAIRWAAGRTECHLEVLRMLRPGFRDTASFEIAGLEHLSAAVAKGRGCLLWVGHFCFNSLAVKAAIAGAGHRLWHVSRREHGFSKTRFGMRVLNPMRVAAERRYLAGRILIDRANPGGALVAARRTLEAGDVVSFTAGAWEGVRPIDVELVGSRLSLSTGAPGLALMTGTPLLPVFATRADRGKVRIEIGAPIAVPSDGTRDDKLRRMAQEFADRTEPYIRQCPGEWRGWRNLKEPALAR